MTKIFKNTPVTEFDHNMDTLRYVKDEFQKNSPEGPSRTQSLIIELCAMTERILKKQNEIQQQLEEGGFNENQWDNNEDNFDLDKESVKRIILKEISIGQIFYPSDIADEYNLDLQVVMKAIGELKENKQIVEHLETERHVR